jgi:hypothetical protein
MAVSMVDSWAAAWGVLTVGWSASD